MIARFDRCLAGLCRASRLVGAVLFLAQCGQAAYSVGARGRDGAQAGTAMSACDAAAPCPPPCAAMPQG
ncbi:hypothetical protein [Methylobacterium symbioticum]|uniref:Lipoprotein n=1 Tax=Methylobacterium symbioticum TaxID=2584084 RepID=A0A509EEF8_9HYPH|nr:hypothetical protein [Methylobacterium symbioticum]VUD72452.1 hypothetical protein MET9862_03051 [Methylobacterium symbioticum]